MLTGSTIGFRLKEVQYKDSVIYPEYAAAAAFQRKIATAQFQKPCCQPRPANTTLEGTRSVLKYIQNASKIHSKAQTTEIHEH